MILQTRLLSRSDAVELAAQVEAVEGWRDGRLTAHPSVRDVKRNEQLAAVPHAIRVQLSKLVRVEAIATAAGGDPVLGALRFGRYHTGQRYGWHVDAGYTTAGAVLSFSLMLRSAVGGKIRVRDAGSDVVLDPEPGEAVMWSADLEHCVEPVEEGSRIVALAGVHRAHSSEL